MNRFLGMIACLSLMACAKAPTTPEEQASPGVHWNYRVTMLPQQPPGLSTTQVQQRCLALFGTKVTYTGRNSGQNFDLELTFETKGVMVDKDKASYVTDRPLCLVTYRWMNTQYQQSTDLTFYFDGVTVFEVYLGYSKPATDVVMTPSADGRTIANARRYLHGSQTVYQSGTFVRK